MFLSVTVGPGSDTTSARKHRSLLATAQVGVLLSVLLLRFQETSRWGAYLGGAIPLGRHCRILHWILDQSSGLQWNVCFCAMPAVSTFLSTSWAGCGHATFGPGVRWWWGDSDGRESLIRWPVTLGDLGWPRTTSLSALKKPGSRLFVRPKRPIVWGCRWLSDVLKNCCRFTKKTGQQASPKVVLRPLALAKIVCFLLYKAFQTTEECHLFPSRSNGLVRRIWSSEGGCQQFLGLHRSVEAFKLVSYRFCGCKAQVVSFLRLWRCFGNIWMFLIVFACFCCIAYLTLVEVSLRQSEQDRVHAFLSCGLPCMVALFWLSNVPPLSWPSSRRVPQKTTLHELCCASLDRNAETNCWTLCTLMRCGRLQ